MLKVATTEAQEAAIDRAVRTAAELGVPEQAVALSREEVGRALPLAGLPAGVWFPDGITVQPARLVRRLAPGRARRRRHAARADARHRGRRRARRDGSRPSCARPRSSSPRTRG